MHQVTDKKTMTYQEKTIFREERGSFSQIVSEEDKICIVRWQDNKPVTLINSFADAYPTTKTKRYCKEDKQRIDVTCPNVSKE
ncbi:hypothetical protein J6590_093611 [Homalodisca vitripennis]|nr:hypothetical protein J6590_093611 [Homalodisca vitripennis]